MAFRLRCQTCRDAFAFDPKSEQWPDKCPLCGTHMGFNDRADNDIVMPSIRTMRSVATDGVYRQMETASERRAEAAAEMAGVPASEMSGLKITDLKDAPHQGDVAAPLVTAQNNSVVAFMEQTKIGGFQGGGAEYSGAVQSGPAPNAGARARSMLQQHHTDISGGVAVSDRPALETMQPGYRRRG